MLFLAVKYLEGSSCGNIKEGIALRLLMRDQRPPAGCGADKDLRI